ncbi:tryptophan 7-halogenase [Alteriqipengyuania sp.]|uniref:tryptophan 7-halogenase n=1 Tax=Alteriqipengyuania sp. TaxID=2800692 RepID=UPI0035120E89
MSEAREPLRRIVVVGSGPVGVLSAIGLRRALPGTEVVVVALAPQGPSFADFAATALPFTNQLHERLEIDEARLILGAGGSHRLATRTFGWGEEGQQGVFTHGGPSSPGLHTRFARDWGRGPRNVGEQRPAGSLAEVLADAGRFAPPPTDRDNPLSSVEYALRWNPQAYRDLLIQFAQHLGIGHVHARIETIERDGSGGISGLMMEGQGWLDADLFVDCSGSAAVLASALPGFAIIDWSAALPTRRILVAPPGQAMLALEDRTTLLDAGWLIELAGRDGLQTMLGVGEGVSDGDAVQALGAEQVADFPLAPGRIQQPWVGNVIAIGDASAQFEPLGNFNLDLAHRQLALLLELLPGRDIHPLERAEYNRRAGLMIDGVRDLLSLYYASPRARQVFGDVETPEPVKVALDQFARRGRLPFREESALLKEEQMELLGALGFERGTTPQETDTDPRAIEAAQAEFATMARQALEVAPPYARWMASVTQPSPA